MTADLPLILMNMSGMNGNLIAQADSVEQKMKLLIYSLGTVPIELLFSDCARVGSGETDSWIPTEVVAEIFHEDQFLRLASKGFGFLSKNEALKFYLVSRAAVWCTSSEAVLNVSNGPEDEEHRFLVAAKTIPKSAGQPAAPSFYGWCILLERLKLNPRAVRFRITGKVGNRMFLQFDCALRLSVVDDEDQNQNIPSFIVRPADSSHEFIIPRSREPLELLGMARPQSPTQYSDRLIFIESLLYFGSFLVEQLPLQYFFGDPNLIITQHWITMGLPYLMYTFKKKLWIERGLHALVHRAWVVAYLPTWDPNGPWRWFWKASNFEPWIPFFQIYKVLIKVVFSIAWLFGHTPSWPR